MSEDLPRANVKRIVNAKLLEVAAERYRDDRFHLPIHRDALTAFAESAKIFIHYISATANDLCRESKRQTMNADDVLRAVEETEFVEFMKPLKAALEGYRKANASKKAEKKSNLRKRKFEKTGGSPEDENGEVDDVENGDDPDEGSNGEEDYE